MATAAIGAPDLMLKSAGSALDRLAKLPAREREMLYETFRVWEESDASVDAVAAQLFCHPNTVRHRLRRIEKLTSRSLSRPRSVAELSLAFEVRRWLM
jgi:DNA-binding PucR family transcriptional regulator